MKDVYLMNKETGEIQPSTKVISEFYSTHPWNAAWTDEWEETKLEVENSSLAVPDFAGTVKKSSRKNRIR